MNSKYWDSMKSSHSARTAKNSARATYHDMLDAPPHMVAEIIDGTLFTHPRPASLHARACYELGSIIGPPFSRGREGPGGWWVLFEPEIHLGEDIVVPDLAGWRRERMPEFPEVAYFTLAPDWVCEVLSPSTRRLDLGGKRAVYVRAGVGYIWFADPELRSFEAFALRGKEWVLIDKLFDDASVSLPPFEAISFDLGDLWLPHVLHRSLPESESLGRRRHLGRSKVKQPDKGL